MTATQLQTEIDSITAQIAELTAAAQNMLIRKVQRGGESTETQDISAVYTRIAALESRRDALRSKLDRLTTSRVQTRPVTFRCR